MCVRFIRRRLRILNFQSYVFSAKTVSSTAIIFSKIPLPGENSTAEPSPGDRTELAHAMPESPRKTAEIRTGAPSGARKSRNRLFVNAIFRIFVFNGSRPARSGFIPKPPAFPLLQGKFNPARIHAPVVHTTSLTLPLEDPILKFLLILVIILAAPLLLNKLKIPYLLGLIIAGAVIGPHGLNLVLRDSSIIPVRNRRPALHHVPLGTRHGHVRLPAQLLAQPRIRTIHLRRTLALGILAGYYVLGFSIYPRSSWPGSSRRRPSSPTPSSANSESPGTRPSPSPSAVRSSPTPSPCSC